MKLRNTFSIVIQRSNISKLTKIFQLIQEHKLQLKDKKEIPQGLQQQFQDYHNYQQWCDDIKIAVETQKDLASSFNLEMMPFVEFLLFYDKCIQPIPDPIIESVFSQIRQRQQSSTRLIQLLRLGARQQKLHKLPKQELVQISLELQTSKFKVQYLFFYSLSQLTMIMAENPFSIGNSNATIILTALNQLNILKELALQNPKWLYNLTRTCLRSLSQSQPGNLAIVSQSFSQLDNKTILLLCSKVEEVLQEKPSPKDLIMILWNISVVNNKQDRRYKEAVRAIMKHKDILRQLQKTADYVQLLSVLNKLSVEGINDYEDFQEEILTKLKGIIKKSQSFVNVINFYIIAIKQTTFKAEEASQIFKQIIDFKQYGHQLFSIALFETVKLYPQIVKQDWYMLRQAIKESVDNKNIANYFLSVVKYDKNDELLVFLDDQLKSRIRYINFWAIKLLSEHYDQQNQTEFFQRVLQAKSEAIVENKLELVGQELGLAAFLMQFRQELLCLTETSQFLELYLANCLNIIDKTKGVGNIIYVASLAKSINNQTIIKAIYTIQDQIDNFNHTELFNYFQACYTLSLEQSYLDRVDKTLANKIGQLSEHEQNHFKLYIQNLNLTEVVAEKLGKTSAIIKI